MRSMILRGAPVFGDLMREILEPYKGYAVSDVGTEDDPSIIVRSEIVQKKYKAWRNTDGSYHEVLIEEDEYLPTKPELTD